MGEKSGMKAWVAAGVALLVAVAIVPALTGAANAAPITTATASDPANQWAYGGQGWVNGSTQFGNATITWSGHFGWTVIITVTATGPTTAMFEEQRVVGATFTTTASTPYRSVSYNYHAQESDTAFANITNASDVYVNGSAVPAIGILNASAQMNGAVEQSISETVANHSRSAFLNVTRSGELAVSFSPSLGLIPLNLSGVSMWNSTATASPSASWTIAWTWGEQGYNGTTRSGSGSANGSLSASGPVSVTGYKVAITHPFTDGKTRVGIVLIVQGPFDCYDGFILIPHAFDGFGSAATPYGGLSFGSAAISQENLYVSSGSSGPAVTAADQTFGASSGAVSGPSDPSATVDGQPITTAQAQTIDNGLQNTSPASASAPMSSGVLLAVVVGVAIAAVVGTVGVIEWRSYARRKSKGGGGLVGGYGESWQNGVPPAAAIPPGAQAPAAPGSGPESVPDPSRP